MRDAMEPADVRLARLVEVLVLVERLSGEPGPPIPVGPYLEDAHAAAGAIARRRFDALAAETAAVAATGIEILLREYDGNVRDGSGERREEGRQGAGARDRRPAARRLAIEMRIAIDELMRLIARRP